MHAELSGTLGDLALLETLSTVLKWTDLALRVLIGFSLVIFVHELGHFLAARWMGVRVDRFAVGFFRRVCGYRRGEGFTFGRRPNYNPKELAEKGYGETDYCLNILPFGGYVKMLGEDDLLINEETGEMKPSADPRAFTNRSVGRRMVVVSAGVVFNVLFAIAAYALVFLAVGKPMPAPVIGAVGPGTPAANAGLLPGDRVLSIDGTSVETWRDVVKEIMLADKTLRFRVERAGRPLDKELVVSRDPKASDQLLIGINLMTTTVFDELLPDTVTTDPGPRAGDKVTHVNGMPVKSQEDVALAFQLCGGRDHELRVERPDAEHSGHVVEVRYTLPAQLLLVGTGERAQTRTQRVDSQHLLGLRQRRKVSHVLAGYPAEEAGFQVGDVIAQWDTVPNPLFSEILDNIHAHDGQPIPVVAERAGETVELEVTPRRKRGLFQSGPPQVGLNFVGGEDERLVVADVAPGTPAAALGMPRGAEILAADGQRVQNWFQLVDVLRAAAGRNIGVKYRVGHDEIVGHMTVPSSIVNELNLPTGAIISSIGGADSVVLASGEKVSLPASVAIRSLLEKNVGRTVAVSYYSDHLTRELQTRQFAARNDNADPWQLSIVYSSSELNMSFTPVTEMVDAGGNPFRAVAMGVEFAAGDLYEVYRIIKKMVQNTLRQTGGVGVQHVSGPIGIIRLAVRQAESGFGELLFFLGFISVNLAVINFLPMPVVDGGLMVFLLLEKIRGKPLNLKVQVITTLVGLALIVLVFVFVTFQDIWKWMSGSL